MTGVSYYTKFIQHKKEPKVGVSGKIRCDKNTFYTTINKLGVIKKKSQKKNSFMISKNYFEEIYDNLISLTIPKEYLIEVNKNEILTTVFGDKNEINDIYLLNYKSNILNESSCQLIKRIGLIYQIDISNENNRAIIPKDIWDNLYKSITFFATSPLTASIGSQGFLSLPLYRNQNNSEVKIIRFHIWSTSFKNHIKESAFSIHSHLFHAKSHILCGSIYNTRYQVLESQKESNNSIYEIIWNSTSNNISDNSLKSELKNTKRKVFLTNDDREIYSKNDSYEVDAGDFHVSEFDESKSIGATLFTFNSRNGRVNNSQVIGPYDLEKAPEINYSEIEITGILKKIDKEINYG